MADTRTRRQKLQAMAAQTVSPAEAAIARAKLEADEAGTHAPRTLSRAQILANPDLRVHVVSRRVWDASLRVHVILDDDDAVFFGTHAFAGFTATDFFYDASDPDWDGVE